MKSKRGIVKGLVLALCTLLLMFNLLPAGAEESVIEEFFDLISLDARDDGGAYTIVDQEGNVLMRTARHVHVGDRWQGEDNRRWEVLSVHGDEASAAPASDRQERTWLQGVREVLRGAFFPAVPVQQSEKTERKIGLYSTHGAEAYVPNDGAESVPQGGGVIDVASSLKDGLERDGVAVTQSKETHVPHDANAYKRSRDTAQELLQGGVDAVIDVHRDAIAGEEYLKDDMVQIQLVVGRQNQNQAANQEFAEKLKAEADKQYPGLIKGIFSAKGNYNQDMSPRSLLIEVGTHENNKNGAEESVAKFADVLTAVLYGNPAAAQQTKKATASGGTVWRTIFWILAILVVGGGAFLYISAGSWEEMKTKLKGFTRGEFGDLFRLGSKNRGDQEK